MGILCYIYLKVEKRPLSWHLNFTTTYGDYCGGQFSPYYSLSFVHVNSLHWVVDMIISYYFGSQSRFPCTAQNGFFAQIIIVNRNRGWSQLFEVIVKVNLENKKNWISCICPVIIEAHLYLLLKNYWYSWMVIFSNCKWVPPSFKFPFLMEAFNTREKLNWIGH